MGTGRRIARSPGCTSRAGACRRTMLPRSSFTRRPLPAAMSRRATTWDVCSSWVTARLPMRAPHPITRAPTSLPTPPRTVEANRDGAQQGDGAAAFEVAAAFEHGQGVPPDLVEALAWYVIAERHGYAPATPHAAVLAEELPSAEVREAGRRVDLWWREFGS